jgi:hypothetical protein
MSDTASTARYAEIAAGIRRALGDAVLNEAQEQDLAALAMLALQRERIDAGALADATTLDQRDYIALIEAMGALADRLGLDRAHPPASAGPMDTLDTARRIAFILANADAKVTADAAAAVLPPPAEPAASDGDAAPAPPPARDAPPVPPTRTIAAGPRCIEFDWNNRRDNRDDITAKMHRKSATLFRHTSVRGGAD